MTVALVEQAQRGDRDAYEQLARDVAPRLHLVASRILLDPDAAEDAVQTALVSIWRDLGSLRDPARFDGWAYRIVVRACRSEVRRHRRVPGQVVDLGETVPDQADDIADVATRDELRRAFEGLSHDHKAVVVLHHLMGLPLTEVADILGVPYGTVGSRLHHAHRAMRASIEAGVRVPVVRGQPA